jgi:formamidopyrimidine-DNA glycosylase
MPELPDISAYLSSLERIVGQPLEHVRIASAFLLRTAQPPVTDAVGHRVSELRRIGKRIAIGLDNEASRRTRPSGGGLRKQSRQLQ